LIIFSLHVQKKSMEKKIVKHKIIPNYYYTI